MFVIEAGDGDAASRPGVDALRLATSRRTWHCRDAVRLDIGDEGPLADSPRTVVSALRSTVQQYPDQLALGLHSVCLLF